MRLPKDIHRRLQVISIIGFLNIPIFVYFDKTILGIGITFTISGLVFSTAFFLNAKSLYYDWTQQKIFDWLFEHYSDRALNFFYALFFLTIGLLATINEF